MLNLNRWAIFATAAELKSFTKAAEQLNISKPTISKQIAALEDTLGTKLFWRTTRHLQLTETGEALYKHCSVIMREYNNAEDLLTHMLENPCGELNIHAPISHTQQILVNASIRFLEQYPEIKLKYNVNHPEGGYFPRDADIAIIVGTLKDSNLCYRKLGTMGHVLCAAPSYIEKHGKPDTPQDLANHNFITATYSNIPDSIEWGFTRNGNYEKANVQGNISANDSIAVKKMTIYGAGITSLPTFLADEEIKNGKLVRLLPEYKEGTSPIYAVFPEKKYMPPKVRAYIDFLVDFYEGNPLFNE